MFLLLCTVMPNFGQTDFYLLSPTGYGNSGAETDSNQNPKHGAYSYANREI
jgi:hypothetical protein